MTYQIARVVITVLVYPLLFIWAINQLFNTGIDYTVINWIAVIVMTIAVYSIAAKGMK